MTKEDLDRNLIYHTLDGWVCRNYGHIHVDGWNVKEMIRLLEESNNDFCRLTGANPETTSYHLVHESRYYQKMVFFMVRAEKLEHIPELATKIDFDFRNLIR